MNDTSPVAGSSPPASDSLWLGRCLLAQAPTGIGKTVATLFPLLKACPVQELDKVFFLTAKGSGRALALGALETIGQSQTPMPLRVIELVSREKSCEHPDKVCHGESCPLARGFYDRLAAARAAAISSGTLTRANLRGIALTHEICPYYLGQEVARWCDVIVGDYNHFFDSNAMLHGLTLANGWRVGVLVDEAHNLVDRARAMYSADLHSWQFAAVRAAAPASLKPSFDRLQRSWTRLTKNLIDPYTVLDEPPRAFASSLQDAISAISELLEESPTAVNGDLLQFYFDALQFTRLLDTFDTHSLFDVALDAGTTSGRGRRRSTLCVRNVVPAPFLKPRFAAIEARPAEPHRVAESVQRGGLVAVLPEHVHRNAQRRPGIEATGAAEGRFRGGRGFGHELHSGPIRLELEVTDLHPPVIRPAEPLDG